MAFGITQAGPVELAGFEPLLQQGIEIATAFKHLGQVNAVGEGPVGGPDRNGMGQPSGNRISPSMAERRATQTA